MSQKVAYVTGGVGGVVPLSAKAFAQRWFQGHRRLWPRVTTPSGW